MPGGQYDGFTTADKIKPICPECGWPMHVGAGYYCNRCGNTYLKSEIVNPHKAEAKA